MDTSSVKSVVWKIMLQKPLPTVENTYELTIHWIQFSKPEEGKSETDFAIIDTEITDMHIETKNIKITMEKKPLL